MKNQLRLALRVISQWIFCIISEEGEYHKNGEQNDKIEINYLQKSFGKRVFAAHDLVSRLTADLKKVTTSVDSRC